MKKTLLVMLALVMTIATIATAVSFVSAEDKTDAPAKYINATLNTVTVDGTLSITPGSNHIFNGNDPSKMDAPGKIDVAEFVMDTKAENAYIGAAWDQTNKKIYFAIVSDGLKSATVKVGGKTFNANFENATLEGGQVAVSEDGKTAEIALPIDFTLKHNGSNVYADLEINVTATANSKFEGAVAFKPHAAGFVFNAINQTRNGIASVNTSISADKVATILDNKTNTTGNVREHFIFMPVPMDTKNVVWKFDLNIENMPFTIPNEKENITNWGSLPEARIWGSLKFRYKESLYFTIHNTADNGIVLVLFKLAGEDMSKQEKVIIPLGKEAGETFSIAFEWNEEDTLKLFIDGKLLKTVKNAQNVSPALGSTSNVLYFNTGRAGDFDIGGSIKVHYSNISICEAANSYDETALIALSDKNVVVPEETEPQISTKPETTTVATTPTETTTVETTNSNCPPMTTTETTVETTPDTTTSGTDATTTNAAVTTEDEKGGCGSSLVAYGAVMVVGSALMAVVATSKKKED